MRTEHLHVLAQMPAPLRALLEAELADGNSIVEVGHSFPAPPVGAYVKLARRVATRPRAGGTGIAFRERNGSEYSGEFADERGFFFVLEPPAPQPGEVDMNAIRADLESRQRAADAARMAEQARAARSASEIVDRFRSSMQMTVDKWRDGEGYAIALLAEANAEARATIESILVSRGVGDWRDVEALAALDTPRARNALTRVLCSGRRDLAEAVTRYAPHLVNDAERTRVLVDLLERGEIYGGLTQALAQVREFHPPEIIDALLRGLLARPAASGIPHYAAMLLFLHGQAESDIDWAQRPFWIRFATDDRAERERLFRELCGRIGIDPEPYLRAEASRRADPSA
ncbi:MAG: hypothetical protein IAE82_12955 [Opitutaceae bacterium]|nr:hypothetical protein [Opitutaceae bacterium]